ncbi:MAG: hypothetical protein ABJZ55_18885 [Fuerstiella sp.]
MRSVILLASLTTCLHGCSEQTAATKSTAGPSSIDASHSIDRPAKFVGIWLWWWSDGPAYHLILHNDGRAEKLSGFDPVFTDGKWRLDKNGFIDVRFGDSEDDMLFRVDSDTEIMDVATIPTDRDFPWEKVDKVVATLADTLRAKEDTDDR